MSQGSCQTPFETVNIRKNKALSWLWAASFRQSPRQAGHPPVCGLGAGGEVAQLDRALARSSLLGSTPAGSHLVGFFSFLPTEPAVGRSVSMPALRSCSANWKAAMSSSLSTAITETSARGRPTVNQMPAVQHPPPSQHRGPLARPAFRQAHHNAHRPAPYLGRQVHRSQIQMPYGSNNQAHELRAGHFQLIPRQAHQLTPQHAPLNWRSDNPRLVRSLKFCVTNIFWSRIRRGLPTTWRLSADSLSAKPVR